VASEFAYGLKHVRVEAEHENELTVLVERERAIQEHVTEKRERDRAGSLPSQFRVLQPWCRLPQRALTTPETSSKNTEIGLLSRFKRT
jgi:hypothetical protein